MNPADGERSSAAEPVNAKLLGIFPVL